MTSSRGSYEEVTDLSPAIDRPRESGDPDRLDMSKMFCGQVGDKTRVVSL